ncbi:MAG TPA: amino acid aminotransferase [Candidatus Saccharimonadales bacterium]|nr:amino acid aminotransferase [Candidatus Saccharimonadales bacterium]
MTLPSRALVPAPADPILGLAEAFRSDPRPERVNLAVGVYVDDSGTTPILQTVRKAEDRILERSTSKTYRPIDGSLLYRNAVRDLVFGPDHEIVTSGRSATAQTPGGTGALRVGADFLIQTGASRTIWLSEPTWPNHPQLFGLAGFEVRSYPYLDGSGRRIDAGQLLATLRSAGRGDVVLLHGSCHNPSGVDPSRALWAQIGAVLVERDLLPFIDFAYQGFGDGLREDADWISGLVRPGSELLIASSFSKNFALYNERVGALTIVANDAGRAASALSHLKIAIRSNYSNPPAHGADIIETILGDTALRAAWEVELAGMRDRIHGNRNTFVDALQARGVPGDWEPLRRQRGMFALLGLTIEQVTRLRDLHAVYVVGRGRINVAGLTQSNLANVVEALGDVIGESARR